MRENGSNVVRVICDEVAALLLHDVALFIEENERRHCLDAKLLSQLELEVPARVGQSDPRHLVVVLRELGFLFVRRHKDDLQVVMPSCLDVRVDHVQEWSKLAARRAVVAAEVEADDLLAGKRLGRGYDCTALEHQFVPD